ncbi:MAG: T9SS type A sorting domain-containing protein, partial [Candidatus Eisenbacteria bacterium]|nr:T9SS type A sorting domain-containing protein [Candidatus Eisenbacteria bacterium]
PAVYTSAVAFSEADPAVVLVGNAEGLLYSDDSGDTWAARSVPGIPTGPSPQWITFDPGDRDVAYVSYQGYGGTFVSTDAGATWSAITPGLEGFAVAVDASRPGFVYAVGGWTAPVRSGRYGLDRWDSMANGWGPWFAHGITVDAATSIVYAVSPQGGVARWEPDLVPPANGITDLSATAESAGIRLAWTPPGGDIVRVRIYRSTTSGSHPLAPITVLDASADGWTDPDAPAGDIYYYVVEVVDDAENAGPGSNEADASPLSSVELSVSYIERTPHDTYRYQVEYDGAGVPHLVPGTEGDKRWPDPGETVTLVAHVINKGTAASGAFDCAWRVNGLLVETDRITPGVAAFGEATVELDYVWPSGFDTDHTDEIVTLDVDAAGEIVETYESNNSYRDFLQGLAIYFYTDPETYQALNARLNLVGTMSFEDWLHAQFEEMNAVFARSIYPGVEGGGLERVRLDRLMVAPPPSSDHTEDGNWYLTGGEGYANTFALQIDAGLLHELMHQLGLIDLYNMNLELETNRVGTPDGISTGMTFDWGRPGLMGGGDIEPHDGAPEIYLSRWDIFSINENCGYRRGYYGEFLYDVPASVVLEIRDAAGNPAPGVDVRIFQRQDGQIDDVPEIVGVTDGAGQLILPNRPVAETITTATGHTLSPNPFGTINVVGTNANWLIEMSRGPDDFDYSWMTLPQLNLAFWDGAVSQWTHPIESNLSATPTGRVADLRVEVKGDQAHLEWSALPGVESYTIYRASRYLNRAGDPEHRYENWKFRTVATTANLEFLDTGLDESCRYVVAGNLGGLPGALSNRAFAPRLFQPRDVALHPDGGRTVIDPQNGYALIRQDETGTFLENFGSVHNHLEFSNYQALDRLLDRLSLSHPGDCYTTRQSVKVTDLDGALVLEIGDTGSGPGQLQQPAGVAVDSSSRILVADSGNSRIQMFTSGGTLLTMFGSAGSGDGQFGNLRGLAVDAGGRVLVCDAGNDRVAVLQLTGNDLTWVGAIPGIAEPVGVANGLNGEVLISDAATDAILVYDAGLSYVRSLTEPLGYFGGALVDPSGLVAIDNERVLVCDTGNRRVVTLRLDGTTDVPDPILDAGGLALRPAHPSPFRGETLVTFDLPAATEIELGVYDAAGRRIRSLFAGRAEAGTQTLTWNGRDDRERALASGVYFLRLRTANATRVQRVVLVK